MMGKAFDYVVSGFTGAAFKSVGVWLFAILKIVFLPVVFWVHSQWKISNLEHKITKQNSIEFVRLIIKQSELYKELHNSILETCGKGIYFSYFNADPINQTGVWIALVGTHDLINNDGKKVITTGGQKITTNQTYANGINNLSGIALLTQEAVDRRVLNPIYTEVYDLNKSEIFDANTKDFLQNKFQFRLPIKLAKDYLQKSNFFNHIHNNLRLSQYSILKDEYPIYLYNITEGEQFRFLTLGFVEKDNICFVNSSKMKKAFENTIRIIGKYDA